MLKLFSVIPKEENILWCGKPNKSCFILECIFNPFMPFALIWFLVDAFAMVNVLSSETIVINRMPVNTSSIFWELLIFFILHLAPFWIYLIGVIFAFHKYRNREFVVTDKAVYISGGMLKWHFKRRILSRIRNIDIRRGYLDKILNVGDVVLRKVSKSCKQSCKFLVNDYMKNRNYSFEIIDIPDYNYVYNLISQQKANLESHSDK